MATKKEKKRSNKKEDTNKVKENKVQELELRKKEFFKKIRKELVYIQGQTSRISNVYDRVKEETVDFKDKSDNMMDIGDKGFDYLQRLCHNLILKFEETYQFSENVKSSIERMNREMEE